VAARIAHDKIAGAVDVQERTAARIVFRLRRGRPGTVTPGDENAAVQSGAITVVRQGWRGTAALDDDLTERWAAALADDPPVA
jgi:5'-nucleotidase